MATRRYARCCGARRTRKNREPSLGEESAATRERALAWQPIADAIAKRHGLTANGGPRVRVVGSDYDGTVAERFNEYDKRDRALQFAAEHGVSIDHCCAIGDSRSDLPLFAAVPTSLALNAGAAARAAASAAVDTKDLRDVIPWLEAWKVALH